MLTYSRTTISTMIDVTSLISVRYFEFSKNYFFTGEAHPFWEIIYVDKGQMEAVTGQNAHIVKQGEILLIKPKQFHGFWANGQIAPNVIVITFECTSSFINALGDKKFSLDEAGRSLLGKFFEEAQQAFSSPLSEPYNQSLMLDENAPFAALQMVKLLLEYFCIMLKRRGDAVKLCPRMSSSIKERYDNNMVRQVQEYLHNNIGRQISFEEIRQFTFMGSTKLKLIFKRQTGKSVIEYFGHLKTEAAKNALRETDMNVTQISQSLGYSSIHYFSRQFKKNTGLSPRQYAFSVEAYRFFE